MITLTESIIEAIESHMFHDESAVTKHFKNVRNTEFDSISARHNEVERYEKLGYMVTKTTAQKSILKRKKKNSIQFEDDIWSMFYKLGFRTLNKNENLKVQWGDHIEDTQQLDVVAVGDDAIFVVECKAADTDKATSHSFKDDINNMVQYMNGVSYVLRSIYGKEKRVKFIFATRNYRFQEDGEDITRLRNNGIYHLNDNAYDYICNLIKSYKQSVVYQFYGLMFKNELISNKCITIPALKGTMGNKDYYLLSMKPSTLLKIGFILHRTRVNDSMAPTYQRLLVPKRLKGITKFIDDGGYFPNSIIINFANPSDELKTTFDFIHKEDNSNCEFGLLNIPNAYGIAYIIDGQHRVYGYANSAYKDEHTIPVVAFDNIPSEEQLQIFMDINENQKAVSPSLRLDLEEDLYWHADRLDSKMKALRSSIIKNLGNNSNNILYNMISIGEDPSKLKFKPFDEALKKSCLIPKATATQWTCNTDVCIYNINETNVDKAMKESRKKITQFIDSTYSIADKIMEEQTKNDFLFSNRGTFAFISLIGSLHAFLIQTNAIQTSSSIQDRIKAIEPYIEHLSISLNNLSDEDNRTIKGVLGQGGDTFWLRSYQNIINKQFPDYCPSELTEWKETQDQSIQQEGQKKKKDIREQLQKIVFDLLKKVFGNKWNKNREIALIANTVKKRILDEFGDNEDFDEDDYDWTEYVEISEYKEIISKNFSNPEFEKAFAINLGMNFRSKADKLNWMSLITETKGKKVQSLTRSDINKLEIINGHLEKFMPEKNV